MATRFIPAGEQAAQVVTMQGGTLTPLVPGEVRRVAESEPHDMSATWRGRELTWDKARVSLWNKSLVISLGWVSADGTPFTEFTITLAPTITAEEIETAAMTYMAALNIRRSE